MGSNLLVVNWPMLMEARSDTSARLSTSERRTNTQRMRSRRVRRCHQGGLLAGWGEIEGLV